MSIAPVLFCNVASASTFTQSRRTAPLCPRRIYTAHKATSSSKASTANYTTVLIIPTGIGASIGGYAGDALPIARLLSTVTDTLITHPNVLNGALMYWPIPNAHYVEGYALDQFCTGSIALQPIHHRSNTIGLLLDSAITPDARLRHLQAADAARATLGLRILHYVLTDAPLHVSYASSPHMAASWGTVGNPDALLAAATRLRDAGCDAIAIVADFPDEEDDEHLAQYRAGQAVDSIAGAEAVISHLVTRHLSLPCAHAPSLTPLEANPTVAPKAAAEELGYTFLSCVLVGLSRAPRMVPVPPVNSLDLNKSSLMQADDIDAIVVPADAFGGAAVMSVAARPDTLVIAVGANKTALNVRPRDVGIDERRITLANSYAEAAGFLAAHRAGIDIASLGAHVSSLSTHELPRLGANFV